jgi:NhaP-type Na+/H+ and K+/H+ antiporter
MIIVLYKWIPAIKTYREALFAGWFGPIGVGAIFFAVESLKVLTIEHDYTGEIVQLLFPVIMWMVLSSTIVHGVTVPFLKIGKQLNREVILPIQRSITMSRTSSISNTRLNEHSTASLSLAKFGRMFAAQKKENVQIVHLGATPSTRINVDMIERANDPMVVHIDDRVESMDVVRTTSVLWADTPLRPTDTV